MESSNGMSQGQEINASQPVVTPAQATSAPSETSSERVFRQSEVNDIVKKAKYGAFEDFKRMQSEQPQYMQQKYGNVEQQGNVAAASSEDAIRRLAAEEAQRLRDQWVQDAQNKYQEEAAQKTVQNFWNKVKPGREKFEDFDKVTSGIKFEKFPNVVQLLGDYIDNSDAVLYELGKDRIKLATLENLADRSPEDAIIHVQRLAQSIKDNDAASKIRTPNEPLSQMRPSNAGTDNGVMSVSDYRKKYRI